jgi:two-component system, sensor histidine kinase and response regulator
VIDNLLTNAIKFSQPGTTIRLMSGKSLKRVSFAVVDQGPGIPKEEISSIFGSFKKTSIQPTAGEKSTGLGLSIVKKIMDAHHGEIQVESSPGQGTTFTVSLLIQSTEEKQKS